MGKTGSFFIVSKSYLFPAIQVDRAWRFDCFSASPFYSDQFSFIPLLAASEELLRTNQQLRPRDPRNRVKVTAAAGESGAPAIRRSCESETSLPSKYTVRFAEFDANAHERRITEGNTAHPSRVPEFSSIEKSVAICIACFFN